MYGGLEKKKKRNETIKLTIDSRKIKPTKIKKKV